MMKYFSRIILIFFCFLPMIANSQNREPQISDPCSDNASFAPGVREQSLTANMECYDVTHYAVHLILDPDSSNVHGSVSIAALALQPIEFIELHFSHILSVDSAKAGTARLDFSHQNKILKIDFDHMYPAHEYIEVSIFYHGKPYCNHFGFDSYAGKPIFSTMSSPIGARDWLPCKDVPADKADSLDMIVEVPEALVVVSNGSLKNKLALEGNRVRYWWHEKYPIATISIGVTAYPYATINDFIVFNNKDTLKFDTYYFPDHVTGAKSGSFFVKDMIRFFAEVFGMYPFIDEKFCFVESAGRIPSDKNFRSNFQTYCDLGFNTWNILFFNEAIASQWWGNMITCQDFGHIWLHEGFAAFSSALWKGWHYGENVYRSVIAGYAYKGPGTIYVSNWENQSTFNTDLVQKKAAFVLHMLRHIVGDGAFFKIIRAYASDPNLQYQTATTEQFQAICEQVSGMDLSQFFQQWIYGENYPHYRIIYRIKNLDNELSEIIGTIEQAQTNTPLFEMPVDLTIQGEKGDSTFIFWVKNQREEFQLKTRLKPKALIFDKDKWLLCDYAIFDRYFITLYGFQVDDFEGNHDGHPDGGEKVKLFLKIKNTGIPLKNAVLKLSTTESLVTVENESIPIPPMDFNSEQTNESNPFIFALDPFIPPRMIPFRLTMIEDGDTILTQDLTINSGPSEVLVIDHDFGKTHENQYRTMLENIGSPYRIRDVHRFGFPDSLSQYRTLIYFTGEAKENLLPQEIQHRIADFLSKGGFLLISSQNLAYDLTINGDEADSLFLACQLGVRYVEDVAPDSVVIGMPGDAIANNFAVSFFGSFGERNQYSRDVIAPVLPAVPIFKYIRRDSVFAGIRMQNANNRSRVVYLAFGLEGICGPNQSTAQTLLKKILTWFDSPSVAVSEIDHEIVPISFALFQNYPNPFNTTTKISYVLAEPGLVKLSIFDLLGREIAMLVNKRQQSGNNQVIWNAEGFPSGTYFCRLEADEFRATRKLILLR